MPVTNAEWLLIAVAVFFLKVLRVDGKERYEFDFIFPITKQSTWRKQRGVEYQKNCHNQTCIT